MTGTWMHIHVISIFQLTFVETHRDLITFLFILDQTLGFDEDNNTTSVIVPNLLYKERTCTRDCCRKQKEDHKFQTCVEN